MALFRALWNRRKLWALHLAANAVLLALAWLWLSLPDASAWQLAGSGALALFTVLAALWLQGTTLAAFRVPFSTPPFARTLSRLPGLIAWLVFTLALGTLALRYIPSTMFPWLPAFVASVLVFLLLPVASQVAADGFAAFVQAAAWRPLASWHYYAGAVVLVVAGAWLPCRLVWWIPTVTGMTAQAASMAVRFLLAYFLAVSAEFALAAVVSRLSARHSG